MNDNLKFWGRRLKDVCGRDVMLVYGGRYGGENYQFGVFYPPDDWQEGQKAPDIPNVVVSGNDLLDFSRVQARVAAVDRIVLADYPREEWLLLVQKFLNLEEKRG